MHNRLFFVWALILGTFVSGASAQSVEQLWSRNCASCHGQNGQGGGAGTRTLLTEQARSQDLDRKFFESIKKGVPTTAMSAFGAVLSDEQVWGLVVHLRELQARAYRESGGGSKPKDGVFTTRDYKFKLEPVVRKGLDTPWAVDFLPTGEMLVTERPGSVRVFKDGKLSEPVKGTPVVLSDGQGGLLDIAVHPDYAKNGWIFLSFSDPAKADKRKAMTKIVRGKLKAEGDNWSWTDEITVYESKQEHYLRSDVHYGSRIVFDPKDSSILYFSHGERGHSDLAQRLDRPNGKIHRVTVDGKILPDNPNVGKKDAYESAWSWGHRNPQGLVFDLDGNLWDTEHGPRGGDELNLVLKGRNYGWPTYCFGIEYSDAPFHTPWQDVSKVPENERIVMPTWRWLPSIAACGLDVCRPGPKGEAFPKWKGDLLAGGLAGATVERLRVKVNPDGTSQLVEREELIYSQGRVRDVVVGPDGSIYVVFNGPDRVMRMVPVP